MNKLQKKCQNCDAMLFHGEPYFGRQWENVKYCSTVCFGIAYRLRRKQNPINETKHYKWKGDKVGYYGVHDWITKHYGQPVGCQECGLNDPKRVYHWANLSGEYKRDINDFKRMCVSCHRKFDYAKKR